METLSRHLPRRAAAAGRHLRTDREQKRGTSLVPGTFIGSKGCVFATYVHAVLADAEIQPRRCPRYGAGGLLGRAPCHAVWKHVASLLGSGRVRMWEKRSPP